MGVEVTVNTDIDTQLAKIQELVTALKELKETSQLIRFVTMTEFCNLSGWCMSTVKALYNRPDFPSSDYGKEKVAEVHAILKYFSVPRRK